MSEITVDVCVLGAGVAGLAAARSLMGAGLSRSQILVLEGRQRIGGRLWTARELFPPHLAVGLHGTEMDLGASWIHGHSKGHPTSQLLQQVQPPLRFVATDEEELRIFESTTGRPFSDSEVERAEKSVEKAAKHAERRYGVSLGAALAARGIPSTPLEAFAMANLFDFDYAAPVHSLDSKAYDEDDLIDGKEGLVLSGYDALPRVLAGVAAALPTDHPAFLQPPMLPPPNTAGAASVPVYMNQRVRAVSVQGTSVVVSTEGGLRVHSRVCICALPANIVRDPAALVFEPPLDPPRASALSHLTSGHLEKVVLVFNQVFWPREPHFLGAAEPAGSVPAGALLGDTNGMRRGMLPVWLNATVAIDDADKASAAARRARCGGNPPFAVIGFAFGAAAAYIASASDAEVRSIAVRAFCQAAGLGASPPASTLLACVRSRWCADPFAQGAYAGPGVNSSMAERNLLASPTPPLFWAGEYTSGEYGGSVHGALTSGRRAAQEALRFFRSAPPPSHGRPAAPSAPGAAAPRPMQWRQVEKLDWSELPPHLRSAASTLGYDQRRWDKDKSVAVDDLDWRELSPAQRQAAATLGYNEVDWNRS